ncbi:MAG: integration host factor subunit beta [Anaerolineaceae bacterium]|nr:integration host factor subunit beta [Anaerolineaceae bacterium]
MTKKDIVKNIAAEVNVSQNLVYEIVQQAFDNIIETLVSQRRVELRNFGVFEVRLRAARKARNPRTNEQVDIPARMAVTFKPGKEMARRIALLRQDEASGDHQGRQPSAPSPLPPKPGAAPLSPEA